MPPVARKVHFFKTRSCDRLEKIQNTPSGCRKCLWANSGGLFPYRARDRLISNIFMAGVDLSSWLLPAVRKRLMLACRVNITFFIFDTFYSRIVPLHKENNTFFKIYPDVDPRIGPKCPVPNIILKSIFGLAACKSHIETQHFSTILVPVAVLIAHFKSLFFLIGFSFKKPHVVIQLQSLQIFCILNLLIRLGGALAAIQSRNSSRAEATKSPSLICQILPTPIHHLRRWEHNRFKMNFISYV